MEIALPHIIEYLPYIPEMNKVSSLWNKILQENDRHILEYIYRRYPTLKRYTSNQLYEIVRYIVPRGDIEALRKLFYLSDISIWKLPWHNIIILSSNKEIYLLILEKFPQYKRDDIERRLLIYDTSFSLRPEQRIDIEKGKYVKHYIKSLILDSNINALNQILSIIGHEKFEKNLGDIFQSHLNHAEILVWLFHNGIGPFKGLSPSGEKLMNMVKTIFPDASDTYRKIITLLDRDNLIQGEKDVYPFAIHGKILQKIINQEYNIKPYQYPTYVLEMILSGTKSVHIMNKILSYALSSGYSILYKGRINDGNIIPILGFIENDLLLKNLPISDKSNIGLGYHNIRYMGDILIGSCSPIPDSFWKELLYTAISYGNLFLMRKIAQRFRNSISEEMKEEMLSLSKDNRLVQKIINNEMWILP